MQTAPAIEELWAEHQRVVQDFLARRCGDRELAEDLTAETFLHATIAMQRGTEVTMGWIMTVARRRLMDHWRSGYRRADLTKRIAHERSSEEADLADLWSGGRLDAALEKLCDTQRSALVLRYCHGHTVQQVADRLNLSYTATESLLARGRRRLAGEYTNLVGVA